MAKKKGEGQEKQKSTGKAAKRKLIPPFIMLLAGAAAGILMIIGNYELHSFLLILFLVMLSFYMLGCILKYALDRFDIQNKAGGADEGAVIEKEPEEEAETETAAAAGAAEG